MALILEPNWDSTISYFFTKFSKIMIIITMTMVYELMIFAQSYEYESRTQTLKVLE